MNLAKKVFISLLILILLTACSNSRTFYHNYLDFLEESGNTILFDDLGEGLYQYKDFYEYKDKVGLVYIEKTIVQYYWILKDDVKDDIDKTELTEMIMNSGNVYTWLVIDNNIYVKIQDKSYSAKANSNKLKDELLEAKEAIVNFLNIDYFDVSDYMK